MFPPTTFDLDPSSTTVALFRPQVRKDKEKFTFERDENGRVLRANGEVHKYSTAEGKAECSKNAKIRNQKLVDNEDHHFLKETNKSTLLTRALMKAVTDPTFWLYGLMKPVVKGDYDLIHPPHQFVVLNRDNVAWGRLASELDFKKNKDLRKFLSGGGGWNKSGSITWSESTEQRKINGHSIKLWKNGDLVFTMVRPAKGPYALKK